MSSVVATAAVLSGGQTGLLVVILVIARFNEGASAACAVPTTLVLLSRATDGEPKRRLRVMGLFEITSLIGMILGFVLAGVSWDSLGAKAFLLLAPLYLGAWSLIGARRAGDESLSKAAAPVFDTLLGLAQVPGNVAFGISWLSVNAVVGIWIQQAPYLLKLPSRSPTQALVGGYSGREIGLVFGGWGVVFIVGIALWSLLGARWERRRVLAVALAGMLAVVATLTFVNHGAPAALMVLAALFVLVESGYTPVAFAHLADATVSVDPSRGAALGLYSVLLAAGPALGQRGGCSFRSSLADGRRPRCHRPVCGGVTRRGGTHAPIIDGRARPPLARRARGAQQESFRSLPWPPLPGAAWPKSDKRESSRRGHPVGGRVESPERTHRSSRRRVTRRLLAPRIRPSGRATTLMKPRASASAMARSDSAMSPAVDTHTVPITHPCLRLGEPDPRHLGI